MRRSPPPAPRDTPPGARLVPLLAVVGTFFALPAALFLRYAGTEGSARVAIQILALTPPATGALVLRLNPDLVPDREGLRRLSRAEWARAVVIAALLGAALWWVARG